jgi:hypothetical protein
MKASQAYLALAKAIEEAPEIPPCQTTDFELWFAEHGDSASTYAAKRLCQTCPVITECLAYALVSKEPHGVWGGMTAKERSQFRGNRRIGLRKLVV